MVKKKGKAQSPPEKKKYSLRLTRKGVALWLCLIFFISGWMFALGILVGRGTAPFQFDIKKLQKELAALKEKSLTEQLRRYKIDKDIIENKSDLPFYEALKANTEEVSLPAAEPVKEKKRAIPNKAVPQPPQPDTPETVAKEKIATAGGTDQTPKKLTVQVASVKNPKDADRMVIKLKNKGFPAYRTIAKIPGKGIWFRVRVGPCSSRTEADNILIRLKKEKLKGMVLTLTEPEPKR